MIDDGWVQGLAAELIAIPSVTGDEAAVAARLAERCERLGLRTSTQTVAGDRINVIATLPGRGGRTLLLTGHMDVVPPGEGWSRDPFTAHVEDGRLYGRGACDMKGGLAAMLGAVEAVHREGRPPAGDVVFAAVVGEEEDQAGTIRLVEEGLAVDLAIIAEPTESQVIRGHKGCLALRVTLAGRAAHASTPTAGSNAIEHAADLIGALRGIAAELTTRPHPGLGPGTLTVGTIAGGTRPYVVPDRCVLEIDRRLIPGEDTATALGEIARAVAAIGLIGPPPEVEVLVAAMPYEMAASHPLVALVAGAVADVGGSGEVGLWSAASDASVLVNQGGIPTVLAGPGSIEGAAHQPDEYVELDELRRMARAYEAVIRRLDEVGAGADPA